MLVVLRKSFSSSKSSNYIIQSALLWLSLFCLASCASSEGKKAKIDQVYGTWVITDAHYIDYAKKSSYMSTSELKSLVGRTVAIKRRDIMMDVPTYNFFQDCMIRGISWTSESRFALKCEDQIYRLPNGRKSRSIHYFGQESYDNNATNGVGFPKDDRRTFGNFLIYNNGSRMIFYQRTMGVLSYFSKIPTRSHNTREDWVGHWETKGHETSIVITQSASKHYLVAKGYGTYGEDDPERVRRGSTSDGQFMAKFTAHDYLAEFAVGEVDDPEPGLVVNDSEMGSGKTLAYEVAREDICKIRLMRVGDNLIARDNQRCGGYNFSFNNSYFNDVTP